MVNFLFTTPEFISPHQTAYCGVIYMYFVADFIRLNLNFSHENITNLLFESSFGGVGGNVCTSSIARWKARGQLSILGN